MIKVSQFILDVLEENDSKDISVGLQLFWNSMTPQSLLDVMRLDLNVVQS